MFGHLNNSKGKEHVLLNSQGYPLSGKAMFNSNDIETSSYEVTKSKSVSINITPSPEEPKPKEPVIKNNLLAGTSDI